MIAHLSVIAGATVGIRPPHRGLGELRLHIERPAIPAAIESENPQRFVARIIVGSPVSGSTHVEAESRAVVEPPDE